MIYLIPSLLIIYLFRNWGGKCFAQREKCMNTSTFNNSVLKGIDDEWYYPSGDLKPDFKGSYRLKDEYPENIEEWRRLAKKHLHKWIYFLVNKFHPQWDPFSDFVHYMTFKQQLNDCLAVITILVTSFFLFSHSILLFIIFGIATIIIWTFAYLIGFNKHLKKLTIKK